MALPSEACVSIHTLPPEVWLTIAPMLGLKDWRSLRQVGKRMFWMMNSESIAREVVKPNIAFTKEGKRAINGTMPHVEALGRVSRMREAYANADPSSVALLAYGEDFLYNDGVLFYISAFKVCIIRVHDIQAKPICVTPVFPLEVGLFSFLYYKDGILSYQQRSHLLFVDAGSWKVLAKKPLPDSGLAFVRNNTSFLYYGELRVDGWFITGINLLHPGDSDRTVHLESVEGSDIGKTICFEIFGRNLYAVSTEAAARDEISGNSFYACQKVCLETGEKSSKRIWRRANNEGPIHDSWTSLSLQVDESNEQIAIVECRQEWLDGQSSLRRTCYTQSLDFLGPEDPRKRLPRYSHSECPDNDFTLKNTKFHDYSLASKTFIDFVSDSSGHLFLRFASCSPKSPIDENGFLYPPIVFDNEGRSVEGSEEHFVSHKAKLWPCPSGNIEPIRVMRDESALVYSTKSVKIPGMKDIILIGFNPAIKQSTSTPTATSTVGYC